MKIGYEVGRGRTFTPSMNASWIDEFNELLNKENLSRNALTEKLIEDGLKYNKRDYILLEANGLSPEQASLLGTEAGQEILKNVLKLLLGDSSATLGNSPLLVASSNVSQSLKPIENNPKVNDSDKDRPKDQLSSGDRKSPLDKLRNKMTKINDSVNDFKE